MAIPNLFFCVVSWELVVQRKIDTRQKPTLSAVPDTTIFSPLKIFLGIQEPACQDTCYKKR